MASTTRRYRKWSWWEVLLWVYSTIYVAFIVLVMISIIISPPVIHNPKPSADAGLFTIYVVLTLPLLGFLVYEGVQHLKN